MTIGAIVVALALAFLAFKFVTGAIKFVIILAVLAAAAWFVMGGVV
ncbi:MAG: hypothetical protein ABI898_13570 [Sphingomonadales bacterium]